MNEMFFLLHVFSVIFFVFIALKINKNYLIALIIIQTLIANLFVIKQITLFGKIVTCTDVFIVGIILSQNILQEYYGKEEAKKTIYISFFSLIFFLIMSKIHLFYIPNILDTTNNAFEVILKNSPRIIIASIFVFFLVQRIDIFIFGFIKNAFKGKFLPLRMFLSNTLSQFIDTVLFSFIGLYGIVSNILDVMLFSFLIKVIVITIASSFMSITKKIIKKEKISV
ncbi:MAG: hypothetical protein K1060chlam5_00849 [Candidatus Anoxychlamydiales bacterium]|nr:hypothetical protein [Candidatus Anoxychlamydiales bacterium]